MLGVTLLPPEALNFISDGQVRDRHGHRADSEMTLMTEVRVTMMMLVVTTVKWSQSQLVRVSTYKPRPVTRRGCRFGNTRSLAA
jgi:hypothetical protein